ncbi:hypothetical protein OO007_01310 [Cocleimonas sp. KMM 6892]|uniref:hypothetical protein n=1 Tax=unclassified Cocleimonas TaxID=2639732 RepID=UPI002DB72F78|nr:MULTISPECIES: hypothetical protein [unclassified Cocleimonas]MEB8430844.1 hypothetical protein [Cocleimonas sp. KMM 6892]MEC4714384.1 hypothetical protein [Cocleimonas sp. KMM 6895]MEC4743715.1 hypothetical protein [Cocleimonas sp. KMM 6896]
MKIKQLIKTLILPVLLISTAVAHANEVEIVDVKVHQAANKTWTFAVTLKHEDAGWDHYANEWQVIAPDDKILATRTLYHPHVNEQPFTRNTSGVEIPADITTVRVIARDTVHGHSKTAMQVNLKTKEVKPVMLALKKTKKKS